MSERAAKEPKKKLKQLQKPWRKKRIWLPGKTIQRNEGCLKNCTVLSIILHKSQELSA